MNDRKNGIVKWFNDTKGYGFIASEGRDLFVHYKSINSGGFKTLKEGQQITNRTFRVVRIRWKLEYHMLERGVDPKSQREWERGEERRQLMEMCG